MNTSSVLPTPSVILKDPRTGVTVRTDAVVSVLFHEDDLSYPSSVVVELSLGPEFLEELERSTLAAQLTHRAIDINYLGYPHA